MNTIYISLTGIFLSGLATGIGAIPVLFLKKNNPKLTDALLGFAAGIMLAATFFSLLLPALDIGGILVTIVGMVLGGVLMSFLDKITPHMHFIYGREGPSSRLKKIWLFVFAITLHNFPEGLSVGLGFGSGNIKAGIIIATAIGLQNMPEGLAVALPLVAEGYTRWKSLLIATLSGLVEPLMGLLGFFLVSIFKPILPYGLAFAAGAMLYVISEEVIPESHRRGFEKEATFSLMAGFIVMMILDYLLG
ncbi:MAG: ZIP family metal transporter [Caldiserica bacterium]|nr:MAG: ZIP family metal transporter [Caldisericota bacterium]